MFELNPHSSPTTAIILIIIITYKIVYIHVHTKVIQTPLTHIFARSGFNGHATKQSKLNPYLIGAGRAHIVRFSRKVHVVYYGEPRRRQQLEPLVVCVGDQHLAVTDARDTRVVLARPVVWECETLQDHVMNKTFEHVYYVYILPEESLKA